MAQPRSDLNPAELDALLRKALGVVEAGRALSASAVHAALPRALRPSLQQLAERLRALAQAGDVHVWPGRTTSYAARPYDEHLRERLPALLAQRPLTAAEVARAFPASVAPRVRAVLRELVREGRVFKHPRLGRREPYALGPPDALDYLRAPLERVVKEQVGRGFGEAAVRDALRRFVGLSAPTTTAPAPVPSDDERVLATLQELDPQFRQGALVYVPHLRQALPAEWGQSGRFERALLGLLTRGVVQLQSHPVPSQLTDGERAAMIPDGRGGFYMAVGLRR